VHVRYEAFEFQKVNLKEL
jgi:hypothetical protein